MIRKNPLNIRYKDGSDLVLDESALHQMVTAKKPIFSVMPEHKATAAEFVSDPQPKFSKNNPFEKNMDLLIECSPVVAGPSPPRAADASTMGSDDSVAGSVAGVDPIADLAIAAPVMDLDTELNLDLKTDFPGFSFVRQPTIRSSGANVSSGRSRSPGLIQRMRSVRQSIAPEDMVTSVPDSPGDTDSLLDLEKPLPDSLLKIISFSPHQGAGRESQLVDVSPAGSPIVAPVAPVGRPPLADPATLRLHGGSVSTFASTSTNSLAAASASTSVSSPRKPEAANASGSPSLAELFPVSADDRGRLFMQFVKISNLRDLPLDQSRRPRFTLTMDNGIQTVTTAPTPLDRVGPDGSTSVELGQEFELLVGKDLELVITMSVQQDPLQPPTRQQLEWSAPQAVTSQPPSPKKGLGFFGRLTTSTSSSKIAKQRMQEQRQAEAQERQLRADREHEAAMKEYRRRAALWREFTGPSGELARGYLFESHYEREIFGEAHTYALPLYNEWAGDEPRHVCELQVVLMFVPKLYRNEELPGSMRECQLALEQRAEARHAYLEGFLTQNGGDCTVWRRRWFTLSRGDLVGHHETTRKARALIHLENADGVVDVSQAPPGDDCRCIYEDRSFRVTFRDGEALSFYADTVEQKDFWIAALQKNIKYKHGRQEQWTDLVLDRRAAADVSR